MESFTGTAWQLPGAPSQLDTCVSTVLPVEKDRWTIGELWSDKGPLSHGSPQSLGLGKRHSDYRSHNPQGSSFAATQTLHWGSIFSYSPFAFLEEQNGRAWFQDDLRHQSEVKVTRHIRLFATPWVVDRSGSSVQGILQVRILEWVAVPFFRGSSLPRNWTLVSCIAGRFFTIWVT